VYRAEDTNLSREVAIKVLPEQFTKDPQRLARFEREAKLLASLNHPNIAAIHSFEHADDVHFLVLELVPGETLQERVAKGPVPVEEALEVCRQIAEGVEAAHEKGVIHRDLKPANVKVTPEGKVKILDFGLAKAFEAETPVTDISQSPTLTEEMTRAGVILGTAAYMSPEQAKGEPVDKRADIFAFGCVLYELLTGKRTFDGKTITETLGAIIHKEPEWEALPATTPWRIQELLRRCLTKDAHDRLPHIANVRIEIKLGLKEPTTGSPIGQTMARQPGRWRQTITLGVVALVGIGIGGMAIWSLLPSTPFPQPQLNKFVVTPSPTAPLTERLGSVVAISSDGKRIVYVAESEGIVQLYVRFLDEFEATPIPGTEGTDTTPFISPDGEWVGFVASSRQLKKVSLVGGSPITLSDIKGVWRGGSWFEDTIVFGMGGIPDSSLYRLSAAGGKPELLVASDPERRESYSNPHILPGGKAVLFNIDGPEVADTQIAVLSLETAEQKVLLQQGAVPYYAPTGHVVYNLPGTETLMAIPFDLGRLEVTGDPVPVLEGIRPYASSASDYALSQSGALIYVPTQEYLYTPVWVDRKGTETPISQQQRAYARPRISPDGKQILFTLRTTGQPGRAAIYDLEPGSFSLLAFEEAGINGTIWTPDGKWITFGSNLGGEQNVYRQLADRSAVPEQLTTLTGELATQPASWSPDGRVLTYSRRTANPRIWDIFILNREESEEPQPLIVSPDNHACCAVFSPDGKWLAYVSAERGSSTQVYVRPYPGPDVKFLVSEEAEGGGQPVWSPDGRELFYRSGNRMMVVSVQTEPTFRAGRAAVLFEGSYRSTPVPAGLQYYDISPDGQRFLMIRRDEAPAHINVVLNWFEELKRLVPTP